ncbi:hypothetical protein JAK72_19445 [Stenotrophomonas maltophilia]|nr:hypothetical protein [Stenotrophomonas maltophilia]MCF3493524.1 hypothetical protein [Stenotrophomonas maltophilia]MCF3513832.1 hypothetical protein [Stenotrophomonas maltophilia]MCU1040337.1 hypothetical protein [Stenotrophomonas maltophilia]MCU1053920.1 hypothetical protein [Stenotrophomonas maltophilia]
MRDRERWIVMDGPARRALMVVLLVSLAGCGRSEAERAKERLTGVIGGTALNARAQAVWIWELDREADNQGITPCGPTLRSATFQLRWPEMAPRTKANRDDYNTHHSGGTGDSQWIEIGMSQGGPGEIVSLQGTRERALGRDPAWGMPYQVSLEFGWDETLGLEMARPSVSEPKSYNWNRINYSDTFAIGATPNVLIRCMTGPQYRPPHWTPLCEATLEDANLKQVHLSIRYRQNLLPHWRDIERDVRQFLRSVQRECPMPGHGPGIAAGTAA